MKKEDIGSFVAIAILCGIATLFVLLRNSTPSGIVSAGGTVIAALGSEMERTIPDTISDSGLVLGPGVVFRIGDDDYAVAGIDACPGDIAASGRQCLDLGSAKHPRSGPAPVTLTRVAGDSLSSTRGVLNVGYDGGKINVYLVAQAWPDGRLKTYDRPGLPVMAGQSTASR